MRGSKGMMVTAQHTLSFYSIFFIASQFFASFPVVTAEPNPFRDFDLMYGDDMYVVRVSRLDWQPRNSMMAGYGSSSNSTDLRDQTITSSTQAIFTINSTNPSINIDNFASIKRVDCKRKDTVTLTFDLAENLDAAEAAWSQSPYLVFWLNPQYKCFGSNEVQAFNVSHVVKNKLDRTLIAVGHQADHTAMFGDFEVTVRPGEHVSSSSFNLPVDMNYKDGHVLNPNKVLINSKRLQANCTNCYLSGSMSWELYIRAKKWDVKEYRLIQKGAIKGNMDMNLLFPLHHDDNLIRFSLAALPLLNPLTVPGVLTFGPELSLDMAFSYGLMEPFSMAFGFDYGHSYELDIHSDKGLASIPNVVKTVSSIPTRAHTFNHSTDVAADLGLHLIPTLGFKLQIGGIRAFEVALSFDNSVGVQIFQGNKTICKGKKEYRMYHEHSFDFDILNLPLMWKYRYPFWDSGKSYIHCPFCTDAPENCKSSVVASLT